MMFVMAVAMTSLIICGEDQLHTVEQAQTPAATPSPSTPPWQPRTPWTAMTGHNHPPSTSLNWPPDVSIYRWRGIIIEGSPSRGTRINLYDGNLAGEIPPELGQLSNLVALHLGENRLEGRIPPQLGQLSNLKILSLYQNQLTREIPAELGKLADLIDLDLFKNQLPKPLRASETTPRQTVKQ